MFYFSGPMRNKTFLTLPLPAGGAAFGAGALAPFSGLKLAWARWPLPMAPMHCTGWPATARLWQAFPEIFRPAGVGTVLEF